MLSSPNTIWKTLVSPGTASGRLAPFRYQKRIRMLTNFLPVGKKSKHKVDLRGEILLFAI